LLKLMVTDRNQDATIESERLRASQFQFLGQSEEKVCASLSSATGQLAQLN
jgi:hypothetical protein